eukprot:scaffold204954_cov27-Tisochrysis_lutea.AAC.4
MGNMLGKGIIDTGIIKQCECFGVQSPGNSLSSEILRHIATWATAPCHPPPAVTYLWRIEWRAASPIRPSLDHALLVSYHLRMRK